MTQLTDKGHWALFVPDDANMFEIRRHEVINAIDQRDGKELAWQSHLQVTHNFWILPPGTWQFLFTTKGVTEEQAASIVEGYNQDTGGDDYQDYYRDYLKPNDPEFFPWIAGDPVKSMNSLLRSKGCDTGKNWAIIQKQTTNVTE